MKSSFHSSDSHKFFASLTSRENYVYMYVTANYLNKRKSNILGKSLMSFSICSFGEMCDFNIYTVIYQCK